MDEEVHKGFFVRAKKFMRQSLRKKGYDIVRYEPRFHPLARQKKLLDSYGINLVLDVGAYIGEYGEQLRDIGYRGKIISFEPLSSAYTKLVKSASADKSWIAINCALGNFSGKAELNVAKNSVSSSMLDMLSAHLHSAPESAYIGKEQIEVRTLDSLFEEFYSKDQNVLLKIDTQGFERFVIEGAENSLRLISTIKLEMSLIPLYKEELVFHGLCQLLEQKGFQIVGIEPDFFYNEKGEMLQVDGIFHRF